MKEFHDHLDQCEQCRNHPFDLCPTGDRLLLARGGGLPRDFINAMTCAPFTGKPLPTAEMVLDTFERLKRKPKTEQDTLTTE